MGPGVGVPLAFFAAVVMIVALVHFIRIHDLEAEAHRRIHHMEMEHREIIQRLEQELSQLKMRKES
ncbi:MAG: hypothetical protein ACRD2G_19675 [Terriglobia bacterium]